MNIYDLNGKLIKRLLGEYFLLGEHQVIWDGTNESNHKMASGVYLYQILVNNGVGVRRMVLLR